MASEKRLIDVNKVINAMQKCLDEKPDEKGSVAYFAFKSIIECLKQEPTVDAVEVVHGCKAESAISKTGLMCTACYSDIDLDAVFCKYCGAKMDGERKDNERKAD